MVKRRWSHRESENVRAWLYGHEAYRETNSENDLLTISPYATLCHKAYELLRSLHETALASAHYNTSAGRFSVSLKMSH